MDAADAPAASASSQQPPSQPKSVSRQESPGRVRFLGCVLLLLLLIPCVLNQSGWNTTLPGCCIQVSPGNPLQHVLTRKPITGHISGGPAKEALAERRPQPQQPCREAAAERRRRRSPIAPRQHQHTCAGRRRSCSSTCAHASGPGLGHRALSGIRHLMRAARQQDRLKRLSCLQAPVCGSRSGRFWTEGASELFVQPLHNQSMDFE